jgi:HEAT repeat protein
MNRVLLFVVALGLLAPQPAVAKSLKKMSGSELVDVLLYSNSSSKRVAAAVLLGERRAEVGIGALGTVCIDDVSLCEVAVDALGDMNLAEARDELEGFLLSDDVPDAQRARALAIVLDQEPERLDPILDLLAGRYRRVSPALAIDFLQAIARRDLADLGDFAVFIAMDTEADRMLRLVALDTAEQFDHPRLYQAYIAFLKDEEKSVRVRCAESLGGRGYPGAAVVAALTDVVYTDSAGPVRAAAMMSLRFYTHPGLLDLVHKEVIDESDPVAWATAMVMLEALADHSSVLIIDRLIKQRAGLPDQTILSLIYVLVRIGDTACVSVLHTISTHTSNTMLIQEARGGIQMLDAPDDQRLAAISRWRFGVGTYRWDPRNPRPLPPELAVALGGDDLLVWTD